MTNSFSPISQVHHLLNSQSTQPSFIFRKQIKTVLIPPFSESVCILKSRNSPTRSRFKTYTIHILLGSFLLILSVLEKIFFCMVLFSLFFEGLIKCAVPWTCAMFIKLVSKWYELFITIENKNTMQNARWYKLFVALYLNKLFPECSVTAFFFYSSQSLSLWDTTWNILTKTVLSDLQLPWESLALKTLRVTSSALVILRHSFRSDSHLQLLTLLLHPFQFSFLPGDCTSLSFWFSFCSSQRKLPYKLFNKSCSHFTVYHLVL